MSEAAFSRMWSWPRTTAAERSTVNYMCARFFIFFSRFSNSFNYGCIKNLCWGQMTNDPQVEHCCLLLNGFNLRFIHTLLHFKELRYRYYILITGKYFKCHCGVWRNSHFNTLGCYFLSGLEWTKEGFFSFVMLGTLCHAVDFSLSSKIKPAAHI